MARPTASPTHYSAHYAGIEPLDAIERVLLGTLICCPQDRERCKALRAADFRSPLRAAVFATLISMPVVDAVLLMHEMERRNFPPPPGMGWCEAVGLLLDDLIVGEEHLDEYVRRIIAAAAERRFAA